MRTIAVMLNTLDPFFFPAEALDDCLCPVQHGSPLESFGRQHLGSTRLLSYHADRPFPGLDEALEHTDLGKRMIAAGVTHIVMPHRMSASIHAWASDNGIAVIAPPSELQRDMEHKIRFDDDLRIYGIAAPRTIDIRQVSREEGPVVAQESESYGLYGTRFFPSGAAFKKDPMSRSADILVRSYEEGLPVGISMLIDADGNFCISALRRQCFIYLNGFPSQFTGVQWVPYSFLDKPTISAVEQTMDGLRVMLSDKRFRGLANFDLLLGAGSCKVLECNPRLSSATAHIFGGHGLMPLDDPWTFFINACTDKKNKKIQDTKIPRSEYEGALLDVDVEGTVRLSGIPEVGEHRGYYLFHELFAGTDTLSDDTFCTLISDTALFDLRTGALNDGGGKLYDSLRKQYIISDSHR